MFPDFPEAKKKVERQLLAMVQKLIPQIVPLLGQVKRFKQHEGKAWKLLDENQSVGTSGGYQEISVEVQLKREDQRRFDPEKLLGVIVDIARGLADEQSSLMFKRIKEVVDNEGGSIDVGGDLKPEHLFEAMRKKDMEFDPRTGEPIGEAIIMHPETLKKIGPKLKKWEADPQIKKELDRITEKKREEWREREARRKLVD